MAELNHLTREIVDEAWQTRINGEIDRSLLIFSQLRQIAPMLKERLDEIQIGKILNQEPEELYLDILLLQASLARGQKRHDEYKRVISLIENVVVQRSLPKPYWLVFEEAITAYRGGDFTNSLESFSIAIDKARNQFERLLATINYACCLYGLGQSFDKSLTECQRLIEELSSNTHLGTIVEQQLALKLFHYFRMGQFNQLLQSKVPAGSPPEFLKLWCLQLPYHRFYSDGKTAETTLLFQSTSCLEPAYRQRTLLGLTHPSDNEPNRISDWADRLYLWVWRWLLSSDSFPIEKVLLTLAPIKQSATLNYLSVEDKKLVRNALLWLGLFDPSSRRCLDSLLKLVEVSGVEHYPLLEVERLLIYYWMALRDCHHQSAKDYLVALKHSPLFEEQDLCFYKLVKDSLSSTDPLYGLWKRLRKFVEDSEHNKHEVIIDFESFKVVNTRSQKQIISEPIVCAMHALSVDGVASFQKIAAVSFGISQFDPLVHNSKIFNLVARMRTVFSPTFKFKTKQSKVYLLGDLGNMLCKNYCSGELSLFNYADWREVVYERRQRGPALVVASTIHATMDDVLSRKQIQAICKKSRATTGRLLQSWQNKGWVKKVGSARSTKYRFSSFLKNEIKEGRVVL